MRKKKRPSKRLHRKLKQKMYPLIQTMANTTPEINKQIIQGMDDDSLKLFCDCIYNVLYNKHIMDENTRLHLRESLWNDQNRIHKFIHKDVHNGEARESCVKLCSCLSPILKVLLPFLQNL